MKKAIIIFVMLLGVGLVSYPYLSDFMVQRNASHTIQNYDKAVGEEDLEGMREEAERYNQNLLGQITGDPFLPGSGIVRDENYFNILNLGGIMGYLEIPKIKVKLAIYHGTSEEILKRGVGHLEGSSLPIGGEDTHAVLTGHTGLSSAKIFTDLVKMEVGDFFTIQVLGDTLTYEVDQIKVVMPDNTSDLQVTSGIDYVTLITCTPYGVNNQRLLVRGIRAAKPEETDLLDSGLSHARSNPWLKLPAILATLFGTTFIILGAATVWKKQKVVNRKKDSWFG